ncbi:MAG: peptidylprolyl isomerase, partial [Deltaproteobacteria bacterium]|nr:peptidylprolyl isomerase [Deltaproteobacteria bacterium]
MGWTWLKILVCSFALALTLLDPPGRAEIVDRIVAIVNDDIITLSELERFR